MFAQYYFALTVNHNTLRFVSWNFDPFICLSILEGGIIRITNYDYDKYFSFAARGKLDGLCDTKLKEKYKKKSE